MSKKISAEEFYDGFAAQYDNLLKDPKYSVQHLNEASKIFNRYNHVQGNILDIGCGTGTLSEFLQGDFQYTGIDISDKMLKYAAQRGYKIIHNTMETARAKIDSHSYDFVFCLGSLLCVKDAITAINHMRRIARQSILVSLDETTAEYISNVIVPVYDHSQIAIEDAIEDYFIVGWTSPTLRISIRTRMVYIERKS